MTNFEAPRTDGRPRAMGGPAVHIPSAGSARSRTSITVLVLIFVGFVSLGLPDGLLGVAWPSIRQTFGLPLDALGALFLTTVCGYLAASLTSGWLVNRLGVGLLLALSAIATACSLLTFALVPLWLAIVLAGILAGLGGGAIDAGLNNYVAQAHSPRLLNWLHACFGVGAATGPGIMLTVLGAGQPWQVGYAFVGGTQLLLGICFLLTRDQWQVTAEHPPEAMSSEVVPAPGSAGTVSRGIGSWGPAVWLSIGLFLLYTGIETTTGQWAYTLFVEGRAIPPEAAGLGISAYWGALALGRLLAGLIADRIAPATLTRWSMAGMLTGAALIWANVATEVHFLGLVLVGLSAAPVFPSLIGVTPQRFGAARSATIIGFQIGAAALGITGLPALAGILAARIGLEAIPVLIVAASAGMIALHEVVVRLSDRQARTAIQTG